MDSPEKPVRVYNTHLDHISYFARVRGLREILRHISTRYQQAPGPVLLMGDFNATPTSQTLRRRIAADLEQSAGEQNGQNQKQEQNQKQQRSENRK